MLGPEGVRETREGKAQTLEEGPVFHDGQG
jgi:hypothetical protein